ncbi:MAG: hypothetical protein CSA66_00150 [Proteobacteria bacterium]|nr:MAG: hypothetical protein CSA66_00150 [Pseudomonadota bacterium]
MVAPEVCDDGNSEAGDGCDEGCEIEDGWRCEYSCAEGACGPSTCAADTHSGGSLNGEDPCPEIISVGGDATDEACPAPYRGPKIQGSGEGCGGGGAPVAGGAMLLALALALALARRRVARAAGTSRR